MSERVLKFRNTCIDHPIYSRIVNEAVEFLYSDYERPILAIQGAPGVGKTSLIKSISNRVLEKELDRMEKDFQYIPLGCVRAPAGESFQNFHWKDFYWTVMWELMDPAVKSGAELHWPTRRLKQRELDVELPVERYNGRQTRELLYRQMLRVIEKRKSKALFIDEAHHFVPTGVTRNRLELIANRLKCMADDFAGAKIVLVGTYDLHNVIDSTNQFARRSKIIDFPRYQYPNYDDINDPFFVVLASFQKVLSDDLAFDIFDYVDEIHRGCWGCVGILKTWFERALAKAGDGKITFDLMEKEKVVGKTRKNSMDEILRGEKYLKDIEKECEETWLKFAPNAPRRKRVRRRRNVASNPFNMKPKTYVREEGV